MSTFKRILAEKTRRDYGRKGGQGGTRSTSSTPYERRESRANMQDPSNTRNKKLGTDKPRVIKAPDGSLTITNMPEPSGSVTTDQVIDTADQRAKKGSPRGSGGGFGPSKDDAARYAGKPDTAQQAAAADDIRGRKATDPTVKKAASNVLGGGRKIPSGEELVGGKTAKPGTGGTYRGVKRPAEIRASGVKTSAYADWQRQAVRARQQLKATGTKFFGKPTGVDAQGKPTYVPPKETPKGETGRRAQRQASSRSYASVKAEIEGAKGFSGSKSGGLETRSVPKPVTDYRQKRAGRLGIPDPFDTKNKFSQKSFEKYLKKFMKKQAVRLPDTRSGLGKRYYQSRPPELFTKTVPSTKPKPPGAPDRTATKQAVKDLRASQQKLNVKSAPTTAGQVTKSKPATLPVKTNALAVRQGNPLYQGAYDAAVKNYKPSKTKTLPKTFAQFAKSGRTAQQKQATVKALQTPPKPKTAAQPKVTAIPKPKAPTRAAVAPKVKAPKITAGGIAGGALSALGAGFDVVQGRDDAKKAGASDTRAWLRGAARAAGGLVGGSLGATGGGLVGGIAGYSIGSALADKTFTALAGATKGQKDWMKQANLASQKGTAVNKVKYKKGTQAVIYDPRTKKERIGTFDPASKTYKSDNLATSKAYTAKNPLERLGRQFSRSNEGSGLFGYGIVKGGALADKLKGYYAAQDEKARAQRVSDFKKAASAK